MADAPFKTVAFVRHGETPLHVGANRFCGELDPELTVRGREQAAHARDTLQALMPQVDAAWMSPRQRARQTAAIILPYAEWQVIDELRELSFGQWEGLSKEEASARTPEAYLAWETDAYRNGPPGGESGLDAEPRVNRIVDQICASPAQHILIVSHITLLRLAIALLMNIPLSEARLRLDIQQGRVGLMEVRERKARLTALNL
ncbi:MAG TPA: histidine phosphatase family protein [Pyrinomonadaceae bacterium]|jgi:probable phosphoglycerate mutase|nr:histidine phosphatase family protein [Pyrinomonadaceae bacterium]